MNHATRSLCISCALVALALGCGKDNPVEPIVQPGPPRYHTPSAPESTVLNYALAWERRDSTMIASALTDDYAGTSVDMADPSSGTLTFTKSDEIRAVGGLALDSGVSTVDVNLGGPWIRISNPGDPPEWRTLQRTGVALYITYINANDLGSNNSTLEFKLKPTASGSDTTWKIIRWTEVHQ